jgi:hypothetical protein
MNNNVNDESKYAIVMQPIYDDPESKYTWFIRTTKEKLSIEQANTLFFSEEGSELSMPIVYNQKNVIQMVENDSFMNRPDNGVATEITGMLLYGTVVFIFDDSMMKPDECRKKRDDVYDFIKKTVEQSYENAGIRMRSCLFPKK